MKFAPKSANDIAKEEQEARDRFLWPPQECDFEILTAEDYTSNAGKESIKCNIKLYNAEGNSQRVFVYLTPNFMRLFRHACLACGLEAEYDAGNITADMFEGKSGRCKIKIDRDRSGQYGDKNAIEDFIVSGVKPSARSPVPAGGSNAALDDDIPFAPEFR